MIPRFIKYIRNIIHTLYNSDVCNNKEQKENIKQNLTNMYNNFTNNNIDKIFHIKILSHFNKSIREEIDFYKKNRLKNILCNNDYIKLLFDDFTNFWTISLILDNLFEHIINKIKLLSDLSSDDVDDYKMTKLLIYHWDNIILDKPNNIMINNSLTDIIYHRNDKKLHNVIENIMFILKKYFTEKYNDSYNFIIEFSYKFHNENYNSLLSQNIDIYDYILSYKESTKKQLKLNQEYKILNDSIEKYIVSIYFNRINAKDFLTENYYKYIQNLETIEEVKLKEIDKYLIEFLDKNIYVKLLDNFIESVIKKYNNYDFFDKFVNVYEYSKKMYHLHTFKNFIEEIIFTKFGKISKTIPNAEESVLEIILKDYKQKKESKYFISLKFIDKEIFLKYYIKNLCKRILNNKYYIQQEYVYYKSMKEYEIEDLYKIEIILNDIALSNSINHLFTQTKTNMLIGRKEIWPLKTKEVIPKSFQGEYKIIKIQYESYFKDRKLLFNTDLLRCDINFNGYTFNVKGYIVDILLMFNEQKRIKKTDIKLDIKKYIKINLIKNDKDYYCINDNFTFPKKYIKIN